MSQNHLPRLRQQRQSTKATPRRLADLNATGLVMQAIDEDRPVSELLDEALAEDKAAELAAARAERLEFAIIAACALGILAVLYFSAVGFAASMVAWGWSA